MLYGQASQQLKHEGNELHLAKRYKEAAQKYQRAKSNVAGQTGDEAQELLKACSLNLASCYLNLGEFQPCVEECVSVLKG